VSTYVSQHVTVVTHLKSSLNREIITKRYEEEEEKRTKQSLD